MISILRTLAIIVLIYYGFKLVFKFLIPLLFRIFLKKYAGKRGGGGNRKKEGEISIDTPTKNSVENDNLGEYVDFQEIDEKNTK